MSNKKFRVWDNVDYMSTPFTLQDLQEKKVQFTSDCIVMQFTGLLDKNKVEIYEGDVVIGEGGKGFIAWDNELSRWGIKCMGHLVGMTILGNIEVIGNIYENPELLTPNR